MSIIRSLARISLLEWGLVVAGVYALSRWWPAQAAAATPQTQHRIIDGCAVVAVLGILGGAWFGVYWLSLIGVVAAATGVGLTIRSWGLTARRWIGRLVGKK